MECCKIVTLRPYVFVIFNNYTVQSVKRRHLSLCVPATTCLFLACGANSVPKDRPLLGLLMQLLSMKRLPCIMFIPMR